MERGSASDVFLSALFSWPPGGPLGSPGQAPEREALRGRTACTPLGDLENHLGVYCGFLALWNWAQKVSVWHRSATFGRFV